MRLNKKLILVFVAFSLIAVPFLAQSRMTFYTFDIILPDEVNASPGDTVTVEGGILVTGMYWLHNFDLDVLGLDYDYELSQDWFEEVRIFRDWNPEDGLYRVPQTFNLTITVPEDAVGASVVTLRGQEHHSFREVSNESYFVLTVGEASSEVDISVSDIVLPEMINEDEPFELSFQIDNNGAIDVNATVSVVIPDDWEVESESIEVSVEGESSETGTFTILPTTTSGEVSLYVEYPFMGEVMNFTKVGPYLVPGEEIETTTTTQGDPFAIVAPLGEFFDDLLGTYAVPVMIGIILILVIIIIWLLSGMVRFVRGGRSEPETMKKSANTNISDSCGIDQM